MIAPFGRKIGSPLPTTGSIYKRSSSGPNFLWSRSSIYSVPFSLSMYTLFAKEIGSAPDGVEPLALTFEDEFLIPCDVFAVAESRIFQMGRTAEVLTDWVKHRLA